MAPLATIHELVVQVCINDEDPHDDEEHAAASRTKEKRVSFYGRVKVLDIPGREYLTDTQKASLWYNQEESEQQYAELAETTALMAENVEISVDDENHCPHGLETPFEHNTRKGTRLKALHELLNEQAIQWEDDMEDSDFLADVYFAYTCCNQKMALKRGRLHEKEVQGWNCPGEALPPSIAEGEKKSFAFVRSRSTFLSVPTDLRKKSCSSIISDAIDISLDNGIADKNDIADDFHARQGSIMQQ